MRCDDLHVRYGRVHAVEGVSINLAPGQIVAVLGANGAGKSSMLRALLGIEKIADGQRHFDGHDITALDAEPAGARAASCWCRKAAAS